MMSAGVCQLPLRHFPSLSPFKLHYFFFLAVTSPPVGLSGTQRCINILPYKKGRKRSFGFSLALPCSRGIGELSLCRSPCACPIVTTPPGVLSLTHTNTSLLPAQRTAYILAKDILKNALFPTYIYKYIYNFFFVCVCTFVICHFFCVDLFFGEPSHSHPSFLRCQCCCLTGRLLGVSHLTWQLPEGLAVSLSAGGMRPLCNQPFIPIGCNQLNEARFWLLWMRNMC